MRGSDDLIGKVHLGQGEQSNKTPKHILYMIKRILELEEVLDERIKSRVL